MTAYVGTLTPSSLHYERHHAGIPTIDPAQHRLVIHGMVDRPISLSMAEIKRLPSVTRTLVLIAGKQTSYEVPLLEAKVTAPRLVRRWPSWGPWLVLAGGGAMVGGGALGYAAARTNFASYDRAIAARCPHGCDAAALAADPDLQRRRSRGDTEQTVAISLTPD